MRRSAVQDQIRRDTSQDVLEIADRTKAFYSVRSDSEEYIDGALFGAVPLKEVGDGGT